MSKRKQHHHDGLRKQKKQKNTSQTSVATDVPVWHAPPTTSPPPPRPRCWRCDRVKSGTPDERCTCPYDYGPLPGKGHSRSVAPCKRCGRVDKAAKWCSCNGKCGGRRQPGLPADFFAPTSKTLAQKKEMRGRKNRPKKKKKKPKQKKKKPNKKNKNARNK